MERLRRFRSRRSLRSACFPAVFITARRLQVEMYRKDLAIVTGSGPPGSHGPSRKRGVEHSVRAFRGEALRLRVPPPARLPAPSARPAAGCVRQAVSRGQERCASVVTPAQRAESDNSHQGRRGDNRHEDREFGEHSRAGLHGWRPGGPTGLSGSRQHRHTTDTGSLPARHDGKSPFPRSAGPRCLASARQQRTCGAVPRPSRQRANRVRVSET